MGYTGPKLQGVFMLCVYTVSNYVSFTQRIISDTVSGNRSVTELEYKAILECSQKISGKATDEGK